MNQQIWFCLVCNACGSVSYAPSEDVYSVIERVRQDHYRISKHLHDHPCSFEAQVVNEFHSKK